MMPSTQPPLPRLSIEIPTPPTTAVPTARPFDSVPQESSNTDGHASEANAISPAAMPEPIVHKFFDQATGTKIYLVVDPVTEETVVIDSMLNLRRMRSKPQQLIGNSASFKERVSLLPTSSRRPFIQITFLPPDICNTD